MMGETFADYEMRGETLDWLDRHLGAGALTWGASADRRLVVEHPPRRRRPGLRLPRRFAGTCP